MVNIWYLRDVVERLYIWRPADELRFRVTRIRVNGRLPTFLRVAFRASEQGHTMQGTKHCARCKVSWASRYIYFLLGWTNVTENIFGVIAELRKTYFNTVFNEGIK